MKNNLSPNHQNFFFKFISKKVKKQIKTIFVPPFGRIFVRTNFFYCTSIFLAKKFRCSRKRPVFSGHE